jgi:hypothetical protein
MKGGGVTAASSDVYNGGDPYPEKLSSPATTADIQIDRPYDAERDQEWVRQLNAKVGRWRTTVTVQDTDEDLTPIGKPTVYANALLTTLTPPDYDASSGKEKRWGLTFAVKKPA